MQLPLHAQIESFDVRDDCLVIGDKTIVEIADDIGSTPFYAYSGSLLDGRILKLRKALPQNIDVHYAMKANPMPDVVKYIADRVDGLDVASAGELEVAISTGMRNDRISFAGPGKRPEELSAAVAAGIVVNVESPNELSRLLAIGASTGVIPKIAIRVNPDFELKSSGMRMSGGSKPFGIDAERIPALLRNLHGKNIDFRGFQIFSGSQNLKPEAICESQQKSLDLAIKLSEDSPCSLREINIGGGFGIPYFPGDKPLDLEPIGANLADLTKKLAGTGSTARIVVELGRYIVGEAGIYVTRVVDRKESRGHVFLITDGGLHQHLALSGNFGQVLRKNYPVLVGNKVLSGPKETVSVVGPLCTPLDLLAHKMEMAHAEVGDLIVVFQSGAYGLTASPINFLSHPPPQEILL
jgi:diaminopimelate decarboxylase